MNETPEQRRQRTEQARRASRLKAARVRFIKYATEMQAWGCTVVIPEQLTIPEEGQ